MAIEVQQMYLLPRVTYGPSLNGSIKAIVTGSDNDQLIYNACVGVDGFPYAIQLNNEGVGTYVFRGDIELEHQGKNVWHATAKYKPGEPKNNDRKNASDPTAPLEEGRRQFDITFDIGTQSLLMKYGLEYVSGFAATGETLTNFDGAPLNVDTSGAVQGAQIDVPVMTFSETHYLPSSSVDDAYIDLLLDLVGSKNSGIVRGRDAGTLLLTRATGNKRNMEQWQLTYSWAHQKNLTNENINGATVTKEGWDYMWPEYKLISDATAKGTIPKLVGYHVVRTYPAEDHTQLLGVTA